MFHVDRAHCCPGNVLRVNFELQFVGRGMLFRQFDHHLLVNDLFGFNPSMVLEHLDYPIGLRPSGFGRPLYVSVVPRNFHVDDEPRSVLIYWNFGETDTFESHAYDQIVSVPTALFRAAFDRRFEPGLEGPAPEVVQVSPCAADDNRGDFEDIF
jgi:hypothetical protein